MPATLHPLRTPVKLIPQPLRTKAAVQSRPVTQPRGTKQKPGAKAFTPGITLPADHWYRARLVQAIDRFTTERGIRKPGVREVTAALAKRAVVVSEDRVGRYLAQKAFASDLIVPISAVLGIPPPAIITETEEQARLIAAVPAANASDEELFAYYFDGLKAVRERIESNDQTRLVESADGVERRDERR